MCSLLLREECCDKYSNFTFFFFLFRSKGKLEDENDNKSETVPLVNETGDDSTFELGKTSIRPSSVRQFAVGYLESFMQIRIALSHKQKNLQLRSTSA